VEVGDRVLMTPLDKMKDGIKVKIAQE